MASPRFEGAYTALVTPFQSDSDLSLDLKALDALTDQQVEGGVAGLVPCGTTGESPTLSAAEQLTVIRRVADRAKGRVQVVAGTGTNSTRSTIERTQAAERAGADGVMVVVPYYNRPTQEALARHFITVASAVSCPVVVYNIPARTGSDLVPETLARILDAAPNVVAIKEATGNVLRAQELVRRFGSRLSVLSGDDTLTLPMMAAGARGVISVTSNVLPKDVSRLVLLTLEGRIAEARALHLSLLPVHEAMFIESNPVPVKAALSMQGIGTDAVRGPLLAASRETRAALEAALEHYRRGVV